MLSKISVIVPVYKAEGYLSRCIDSIIKQTYRNLEIILVDDGSPDKSGDICDAYAAIDKRIIVIHKKNEGSSCARNAGLEISTGDLIAFVDSDDYIDPLMLELMIYKMTDFNLDVVEINLQSTDNNLKTHDSFEIQNTVVATERIIRNSAFSVWRRLYSQKVLKNLRFIPGIIHQDVFYTIDVLNRIDKIGFLNKALYHYNEESESIIRSNYSLQKIQIGIRATEYILNNVPKNSLLKDALNNYIVNYYTDHFFLLSRNTNIDPNYRFRKKLRQDIKSSINYINLNLRSLLVIIMPFFVIEIISKNYKIITSR